jgi:transglutaminase-like putative cysteine protease
MDNVEDFLKETIFCDFSNREIKNLADKIAEGRKDNREFAVAAFYWVRDNILYSVGNWQRKASETLAEKRGTCTNKANLLVALLRYKNIPAGYGVMKVYGQKYLGPIAPPSLRKFIGERSTHIYGLVYLDNKWIKVDPSDDKKLCENTSYFNLTTKLLEWDGYKDATLNLNKEDIIEDKFPVENVDPWMEKKSKNAKGVAIKIANIYIDFARNNTKTVSGAEELEALFKNYLKEKYPVYFYLFKIVSLYKKQITQI